jgi:hypothetical protein
MQACIRCAKLYQASHTCLAGHCKHCNLNFKVIRQHKCPVYKMSTLVPLEVWRQIKGNSRTCDGCGTQHFRTKHVHGFQRYNSVDLCFDCYKIPQIEQAASTMMLQLTMWDIQMGKTTCDICKADLIDPQTGCELAAFRREHVNVLDEQCTVWSLVKTGASLECIRHVNLKCRNVCIRCHSALSLAKFCIGVHRLKTLQVSSCIKIMAARKVESLANLLVLQGTDNL